MKVLGTMGLLIICLSCTSLFKNRGKILFEDHFPENLNANNWVVEMEKLPDSKVYTAQQSLVLDTKGGVTVWLNKVLQGNLKITYKRKVILNGGLNDRLSDLNQFWLAQVPPHKSLFGRSGKFEEYDDISMYYVGMGGNYNTTTRFRKYDGKGNKPLIQEKNDTAHLLQANREYLVTIVIKGQTTSFWIDNEKVFEHLDINIPTSFYFGFRSTFSHHEIRDFKIIRL